jgi:dihydroorotate dehydrogenase (NAD+) catalytic subunit
MKLVYDAHRVINIPILGLGGIDQPADVIEYMVAGAAAVEVGTANFADPRACERLVVALERWCDKEKVFKISDLQGSLEE